MVSEKRYILCTIDRKWSSISILYYNTFFSACGPQCAESSEKSANLEIIMYYYDLFFFIRCCNIFGIFGTLCALGIYITAVCMGHFLCVQKGSYVDEDREMLKGYLTLRNSVVFEN